VGETVRITSGPFRGFNGVIEELPTKMQEQIDSGILSELDESMCATIAIDIFGRSTPTSMQMRSLEKL
jgi:transcription antitermination factor NusG